MTIDEVANDNFLPRQVPDARRTQPVQQLWSAVLHRSLQDLDPRKLYASPANTGALAAQWFQSDDEQPGSFFVDLLKSRARPGHDPRAFAPGKNQSKSVEVSCRVEGMKMEGDHAEAR